MNRRSLKKIFDKSSNPYYPIALFYFIYKPRISFHGFPILNFLPFGNKKPKEKISYDSKRKKRTYLQIISPPAQNSSTS